MQARTMAGRNIGMTVTAHINRIGTALPRLRENEIEALVHRDSLDILGL